MKEIFKKYFLSLIKYSNHITNYFVNLKTYIFLALITRPSV